MKFTHYNQSGELELYTMSRAVFVGGEQPQPEAKKVDTKEISAEKYALDSRSSTEEAFKKLLTGTQKLTDDADKKIDEAAKKTEKGEGDPRAIAVREGMKKLGERLAALGDKPKAIQEAANEKKAAVLSKLPAAPESSDAQAEKAAQDTLNQSIKLIETSPDFKGKVTIQGFKNYVQGNNYVHGMNYDLSNPQEVRQFVDVIKKDQLQNGQPATGIFDLKTYESLVKKEPAMAAVLSGQEVSTNKVAETTETAAKPLLDKTLAYINKNKTITLAGFKNWVNDKLPDGKKITAVDANNAPTIVDVIKQIQVEKGVKIMNDAHKGILGPMTYGKLDEKEKEMLGGSMLNVKVS